MSRILAISDIHGHGAGAKQLLELAQYDPKVDRLFLLGDYIDKSPETWETLSFVQGLLQEGAAAVRGNLEQWFLDQHAAGEQPESIKQAVAFVAGLPLYIEHGPYLFVHAGIRPGIALAAQQQVDLLSIREEFWNSQSRYEWIVVFGHTPTYRMGVAPGDIWVEADRIGIDTGAKHGVRLTLLDLTHHKSYSCSTETKGVYTDFRTADWCIEK